MEWRMPNEDFRVRGEAESRSEPGAVHGKECQVGSRRQRKKEREAERSGLAQRLLDPGVGIGGDVGKGEEVEQKDARRSLLEIGSECGGEVSQFLLAVTFTERVGSEERELGATSECPRGGEAWHDAACRRSLVDRQQSGRRARGAAAGLLDEGRGSARRFGIVSEKDRQREGGDVEGGVHFGFQCSVFSFQT